MIKGFTLIEMLLTLTVIALLAGLSAPIYMSFQGRNDLNVANSVVVSSLRRAQTLAR
ncbi:MAG: prepilin-type N-terminal cleavage/methylation domain-containing protein, partial [Candidatus Magasanikbacteria bacterium]|nr:prepilin-type N-terminal cleavage/methylation domain-containing protein [Candidatus Magasanikbacteria bacterium]